MTIYDLYIFDKNGTCLFYKEWKREKTTTESEQESQDRKKLMHGMLHSLRAFAAKLAPNDNKQSVRSFQTNAYKLNYFETPTGLKMAMNTDLNTSGIHDLLRQIYSQIYVEYVVKNPLMENNKEITSNLFHSSLDSLVQRHPGFAS